MASDAWWKTLEQAVSAYDDLRFAALSDARLAAVARGVAVAVRQVQQSRGLAEVADAVEYLGADTTVDVAFGAVLSGRATYEAFMLGGLQPERAPHMPDELADLGEVGAEALREAVSDRAQAAPDDPSRDRWLRLLSALAVPDVPPTGEADAPAAARIRAWRPEPPRTSAFAAGWFRAGAVAWSAAGTGPDELPATPEYERFASLVARVGVAVDELFQGRLWRIQNEFAGASAEVRPIEQGKPARLNRAGLQNSLLRLHVDWPLPQPGREVEAEWPMLDFLVEPLLRVGRDHGWAPLALHGLPSTDAERERKEAPLRRFFDFRRQVDPARY